uniref:Peptidase C1A papain C-terminal domain-containing protein n=1 Tax=Apteryx owenii TaxID=8824 RepID=A0A8B9QDD8_APTOW
MDAWEAAGQCKPALLSKNHLKLLEVATLHWKSPSCLGGGGMVPSSGGVQCLAPGRSRHGATSPQPLCRAQRVREEHFHGQRCAVWQNVSYWGRKKNVYTLRVASSPQGPVPVHYEMRGFNSLACCKNRHDLDCGLQHRCKLRGTMSCSLHSPGAVTPVKDQAVCGSCWSFATTGAMEGALFLKTGVLTPLSQQVLIDCSWGFGNQACDGGEEWRAYEWIKKHGGIASTESYGPYLGQNGYCHYNQSEPAAQLASYVNVEPGSAAALKAALVKHGPVAVNIDASHKSFAFYANGVYEEPRCNETAQLDHAVLAVGYGVLHGKSYWLVKNSWSTYWGNDGYILMAMKDNNCGVATEASFPILA